MEYRLCTFYIEGKWASLDGIVNYIIKLELSNVTRLVSVSAIYDLALAMFCEPVEKENSRHSFIVGLSHSLGLR
jgi:3'(2'), 5'-bisphosphate nucleotidase